MAHFLVTNTDNMSTIARRPTIAPVTTTPERRHDPTVKDFESSLQDSTPTDCRPLPTSRLLAVPAELRFAVYRHACLRNGFLVDEHKYRSITVATSYHASDCMHCALIALLLANRQIHHEVLHELVAKARLVPRAAFSTGFGYMPLCVVQHVTRVVIIEKLPSSILDEFSHYKKKALTTYYPSLKCLEIHVEGGWCIWFNHLMAEPRTDKLSLQDFMERPDIKYLCESRELEHFELIHSTESCHWCKDALRGWTFFYRLQQAIAQQICKEKDNVKEVMEIE